MGLTSGRGSHGGARRRGAGSARQGSAWQGDGGYNRSSLVGGDQQETGYGWNHYPVTGGGQRQATGFLDGRRRRRRAHARRRRGVGRWLTGYSAPVLLRRWHGCAALVAAGLGVNHDPRRHGGGRRDGQPQLHADRAREPVDRPGPSDAVPADGDGSGGWPVMNPTTIRRPSFKAPCSTRGPARFRSTTRSSSTRGHSRPSSRSCQGCPRGPWWRCGSATTATRSRWPAPTRT